MISKSKFDSIFNVVRDDRLATAPTAGKSKRAATSCSMIGPITLPCTERHLQCVWFDNALRPSVLQTEQGEVVMVEHPGQWNLEAGPDFRDAVLYVGPDRRRLAGDVEIHVHPADWRRHGHARNPAYANVVAHVTYFSSAARSTSPGLPRIRDRGAGTTGGIIQIPLKAALAANPFFSFESLDVAAYPYIVRGPVTPCMRALQTWPADNVVGLLESAGQERLRDKAARMANACLVTSPGQVLYAEIMTALGYKNNGVPFRCLSGRLPLETLRKESGHDHLKAYALLMGVAGLLPAQTTSRWDAETRVFVRKLWGYWWKYQADWNTLILRRKVWNLSGLRPQNHPQRRLMLAAILFTHTGDPARLLMEFDTTSAEKYFRQVTSFFQSATDTYWQRRLTFAGKRQSALTALVGTGRIAAIITNVLVPLLAALGHPQVLRTAFLRYLPPGEDNQIIRQTAHNLLGPDHNPALYRSALRQQGLIRIFNDFCLTDRSRCENCALLKVLNRRQE